jgi:exonuclease III
MRIFHVPGTGTTGGVTVVLVPSPYITDPVQFNGHGINTRVIRLDLFFFEQASSLIGVYGPAQHIEREDFYSNVLPQFMPPLAAGRGIIMAGDFNVVASDLDCWYADYHHPPVGPNTRLTGHSPLQHTMDAHGLHDVWREANPVSIATTHMCYNGLSGARLDRFLLSTSFLDSFEHPVVTIEAAAPIRTDHRPVALSFRAPTDTIPRGHGISGFPMAIFNIPAAMAQLHTFICSESAAVLASPTIDRWVNAKARIMAEAYRIYSSHRRARQLAAREALANASAAESALKLNDDPALHARLFSTLKLARNLVITAWDNLLAPAATAAGTSSICLLRQARTTSINRQGPSILQLWCVSSTVRAGTWMVVGRTPLTSVQGAALHRLWLTLSATTPLPLPLACSASVTLTSQSRTSCSPRCGAYLLGWSLQRRDQTGTACSPPRNC